MTDFYGGSQDHFGSGSQDHFGYDRNPGYAAESSYEHMDTGGMKRSTGSPGGGYDNPKSSKTMSKRPRY